MLRYFTLVIFTFYLISCQPKVEKADVNSQSPEIEKVDSAVATIDTPNKAVEEKPILKVLVLPIANGYNYAHHGHSFENVIEKQVSSNVAFELIDFPFKKLNQVPYYGIFSHIYCQPIIDSTDADVIIMSQFIPDHDFAIGTDKIWAYEIKALIVNDFKETKTLGQADLKSYQDLEKSVEQYTDSLLQLIDKTSLSN